MVDKLTELQKVVLTQASAEQKASTRVFILFFYWGYAIRSALFGGVFLSRGGVWRVGSALWAQGRKNQPSWTTVGEEEHSSI